MSENLDEVMGFTVSELEIIEAALECWEDHQTALVANLTEAGVKAEDFEGWEMLDEVAEARSIRERIAKELDH